MQFFGLTDCGKVRTNNEDNFITEKIGTYSVFILADGMGGHNAGEVASANAVEIIFDYIKLRLKRNFSPAQIFEIMRNAVNRANIEIFTLAREKESRSGMGTTVDICIADKVTAYIAHVGDSRVYRINAKGEMTQITRDHSLMEYMIERGELTPEEAATHPQRNIITRALGSMITVEADTYITQIEKGGRLLLCSDGLTNSVDEKIIAETVYKESNPQSASQKLIKLANKAGGLDNITVIVAVI